jgi:hypothetical protein
MPFCSDVKLLSKSTPYLASRCQRIKVESATTLPSSTMNGSLPLGALRTSPSILSNGCPDIFRRTSALMTKGLASGIPKARPKAWRVIMDGLRFLELNQDGKPFRRPAACGSLHHATLSTDLRCVSNSVRSTRVMSAASKYLMCP